jgi:protein PhnA
MEKEWIERSGNKCELCKADGQLSALLVEPKEGDHAEDYVYACATCQGQIIGTAELDATHWKCLQDAIWSESEAVKVVAYRLLQKLRENSWAVDLLEMMYLPEETEAWAKAISEGTPKLKHMDSNGVELSAGDTVVLIKDLKVKGANFTAKRGTAVRNIALVHDNAEQIEGKVEGQRIVILTQYVKK